MAAMAFSIRWLERGKRRQGRNIAGGVECGAERSTRKEETKRRNGKKYSHRNLRKKEGDHDARSNCSGVPACDGRARGRSDKFPSPNPTAEGADCRPHPRANAPKDERELISAD